MAEEGTVYPAWLCSKSKPRPSVKKQRDKVSAPPSDFLEQEEKRSQLEKINSGRRGSGWTGSGFVYLLLHSIDLLQVGSLH